MCVEEAHIVQWSFGTMNLKLPSLQSWARLLTNGLATIFLMNPILPQSSSRFWWWPFVIFVRKRLLPLWPRCHLDVAWVPCKIHSQGTKCRFSQFFDTKSFKLGEVGFQNLEIWSTVPINFHQTVLTKVKKLHFEATLSMITYDVQIVWRAQSALVH